MKGWMEGCDNDAAPTNEKGKKMIRGPMTCKKCGEKGHRQASAKCPLNGTAKKRYELIFFTYKLECKCQY